jgi:tetratricopeptide (TPR) repeat protein/transcriptional regulator with XRE-family HTH domain
MTERHGFGEVLRRHRVAAGLTQEGLAERAHLSTRTISALEQGVNEAPRADTVALLADALALSAGERAVFEAARRQSRSLPGMGLSRAGTRGGSAPDSRPLIGRATESRLLERHLAGEGPPVFLLAGEPGIGKSRVLEEVRARALDEGWTVLSGGCQRRSGQDPYTPLVDAFAGHLRVLREGQQRAALTECAWLVRLLPELATAPIAPLPGWQVTPEQERRLMFQAVTRFMSNVAGTSGTLLILDDLQWAGADAFDLLLTLARQAAEVPLRVVGAYRDTEVSRAGALSTALADLAGARLVHRHPLRPLTDEDAGHLLDSLLQGRPSVDPAVRTQVLTRTGGVPFFLVSCVDRLRLEETGEPAAIPWDVAESVRQRLESLSETARALLEVAAVAGRVVPRAVPFMIVARPEREMAAALQVATRARLLEEVGPSDLCFAHDVIREVVEGDLGATWRAILHRDIAQALEGLLGDTAVEAIADHYARTDDYAKTAHWLERAGDRAAAVFATTLALDHYAAARERLLGLSGTEEAVARLYEKMGDLHGVLGDFAAAREDYAQARSRAAAPAHCVELWRKEGTTWIGRGLYGPALAAFDAADAIDGRRLAAADVGIQGAGPRSAAVAPHVVPPLVRAAVEISRAEAHFHQGTWEHAQAAAERAIALLRAEPLTDASELALAHAQHYLGEVARRYRGDVISAEGHLRASVAVRQRLGTQEDIAWSMLALGLVADVRGDPEEAVERLGQCQVIMERLGHALGMSWSLALLGGLSVRRGQLAAAEELYCRLEEIQLTNVGNKGFLREVWEARGHIAWMRGELAEAEECYRQSHAAIGPSEDDPLLTGCLVGLAQIACDRGDVPAALRWLRAARRLGRRIGNAAEQAYVRVQEAGLLLRLPRHGTPSSRCARIVGALLASSRLHQHEATWLRSKAALVETELLLYQGLPNQARAAAEEALALAVQWQCRREEALAWALLGQCSMRGGMLVEARSQLRRALGLQTETGLVLDAGDTRVEMAKALLAGADDARARDEAHALLAEARAQFATSGATLHLTMLERLAAAWDMVMC